MSALDDIKARAEGHTEGPWHVYADTDEAYGVQSSDGPLTWNDHGGDVFRNRADAELIAAAPKLLAALEAVEALANGMDCASKDNTHGAWDLGYNTALRSASGLVRAAINEALEGAE